MPKYLILTIFLLSACCLTGKDSSRVIELETILNFSASTSPHNSTGNFSSVLVNNKGDVVWRESTGPHESKCYFWNEKKGIMEINIHGELVRMGFEPVKKSSSVTGFAFSPQYLDEMGNVFFRLEHKTPESVPQNKLRSNTQKKLGVWNCERGFNVVNSLDIEDVKNFKVSEGILIVHGYDMNFENQMFILKNDLKNEEDREGDRYENSKVQGGPWEKLPIGNIGARFYVIEKLYKHPKSKKERKYLVHSVESEAAHVLDVLQYRAKKAEHLIEKANEEGIECSKTEEDYNDAMSAIKALEKMLKDMGIKNSKVFELDLPSNNWSPKNY